MSSTSPGETKNIVDALRRALQGPASQLAGGASSAFGSFSISLQPSTEQTPGGTAQTFQSTIDVSALNGFIGSVTLTETDTLTGPGFGSVGIPTSLVQVGPSSPTNDGLVPLNVNVTANCPSGQYLVTVTGTATNNGQTQIAQAVLTVTVGSGIQKCNSDSDCGAGGNCDNGQCISPIDNLIIGCGTSPCGSGGIGTNPCNTSRCRNLCSGEQAGLAPVWLAGCCYCTSKTYCSQNCPQYTAQCQAQWGPCSQAFCDAQNICVCTHCKSTTPISVTCPSNMVACMDATTPTATIASGLFALTNTNPSNTYGITMSVVPTGPNCSCCGGGPVLSTSGFYLTPTGSQQVMVSVPVTCAKKQCYNWNLKISITTGAVGQHGFISTGQVVQTYTCPIQVCISNKPCAIIELEACQTPPCSYYTPTGIWGANIVNSLSCGWTSGGGYGYCIYNVCEAAGAAVRLRSVNGFTGNVTVAYSKVPCGGPQASGGVYSLTAGQTLVIQNCTPTPLIASAQIGAVSRNVCPPTGTLSGTSTATATFTGGTSTAIFTYNDTYCASCPANPC